VTFEEAYTSLIRLYKNMMFPENPHAPKFTMSEIDKMDFGFFEEILENDNKKEQKVYIDQVW